MSDPSDTTRSATPETPDSAESSEQVPVVGGEPSGSDRRTLWIVLGVGGLLLALAAFWWFSGAVTVPDVLGASQEEATASLEAAGLAVGQTTFDPTLTVAPGTVTGQSPTAGTNARSGALVDLLVASLPTTTVPDVVGKTGSEAEAELAVTGLRVGEVTSSYSAEAKAGTVLAQSPESGREVPVASLVALEISMGPQEGAVPEVTGLASVDAVDTLESAGFEVKEKSKTSADVEPGVVISQSPSAGSVALTGATVTITVSTGPPPAAEEAPPADDQQEDESPPAAETPEEPATPDEPREPVEKPTPEPSGTEVPDLIGMRVLEAFRALRSAELQFSIEWGPTDEDFLRVIEQDPSAGAEVDKGTVVGVTIGLPSFLFEGVQVEPEPLPAPPTGGEEESESSSDAIAPAQ